MTEQNRSPSTENVGVSLVDGDAAIRHARQLMLRSENYDVRSYPTSVALLADPRSRDFPCIVIDVEMRGDDGLDVLKQMRASGWRGKAILLDGGDPEGVLAREAKLHGDRVFERTIGDRPLMAAIAASINRSWSGWTPQG
ncbi:response regulator [Sphingomonas sp. So64.6b]|uniref:response regulator n=1 Tax=Sphingomonas sp. So64.6b TaxID=2997354 RepID=UPI0015FF109C|nr:response regulator [Sphingomonas sp. So64.6b]QNA83739.1 response regulator [Sphingomonas sp. So64.6b]